MWLTSATNIFSNISVFTWNDALKGNNDIPPIFLLHFFPSPHISILPRVLSVLSLLHGWIPANISATDSNRWTALGQFSGLIFESLITSYECITRGCRVVVQNRREREREVGNHLADYLLYPSSSMYVRIIIIQCYRTTVAKGTREDFPRGF